MKSQGISLLHTAGLRATPGRLKLIEILEKNAEPSTVKELQKKLETLLNEVTLYRALEALEEAGIVSRVDLKHDHAHYELIAAKKHHHHLVCTVCGKIEDFVSQACETLLEQTTKKVKTFKTITSHSMEVFGLCKYCA